eukprot:TRINITY_DN81129_c0_g1_i1.p1 TRINITY_DN81129_c0_g1~~TRINITY_DN81129_c0_g1_i1.p1  ORF type:complete len:149 (+),score=13.67 TRINITY_DN81129_c0_g1_i1:40-447(+)
MENISSHLEKGSKAVFLMYPKERWEQCGKPDFEIFGTMTDGEGTPWAQWYDEEKIMLLTGDEFRLDKTIPWGHNNAEFINFELTKKQPQGNIYESRSPHPGTNRLKETAEEKYNRPRRKAAHLLDYRYTARSGRV